MNQTIKQRKACRRAQMIDQRRNVEEFCGQCEEDRKAGLLPRIAEAVFMFAAAFGVVLIIGLIYTVGAIL